MLSGRQAGAGGSSNAHPATGGPGSPADHESSPEMLDLRSDDASSSATPARYGYARCRRCCTWLRPSDETHSWAPPSCWRCRNGGRPRSARSTPDPPPLPKATLRLLQVPKAMLQAPTPPSQMRVLEVPKAMLRPPRAIAASPTSDLQQPTQAAQTGGEGTAEQVHPTGHNSNDVPRPGLSATSHKRPHGIFEDEGLTLDEVTLIAKAARCPGGLIVGECIA